MATAFEQIGGKNSHFELDVPATIAAWRSTTYCLLVDTFASIPHAYKYGTDVWYLDSYMALDVATTHQVKHLETLATLPGN
jgi:hypothetical protein